MRLVTTGEGDIDNDPEAGVGILEVFHAGAWGTLCNGDPAAPPDYDLGPVPDDRFSEVIIPPSIGHTSSPLPVLCQPLELYVRQIKM